MEVCVKMDFFDESEYSLEGLTQESNVVDCANFNIGYNYVEEDLVGENVVSLEESDVEPKRSILYDNLFVEDISSDEDVDGM